jgi:predicted outer membrane protein
MMKRNAIVILAAVMLIVSLTTACKKTETTTTTEAPVVTLTAVDTTPSGGTVATATMVLNEPDKQFSIDAAAGLIGEIEFAKTADGHATNLNVKAFAHKIKLQYEADLDELKSIAAKHVEVVLPTVAEAAKVVANDKLAAMPAGKGFDTAFLEQIAADHAILIALFEAESKVVADDDLRAWVDKHLPELIANLATAKALQAEVAKGK